MDPIEEIIIILKGLRELRTKHKNGLFISEPLDYYMRIANLSQSLEIVTWKVIGRRKNDKIRRKDEK